MAKINLATIDLIDAVITAILRLAGVAILGAILWFYIGTMNEALAGFICIVFAALAVPKVDFIRSLASVFQIFKGGKSNDGEAGK